MKNFLIKKLSLLCFCFITPVLSYATLERQDLFAKITNSIQRMINGKVPEIHQDFKTFNDSEIAQTNLNIQQSNSDTSILLTETTTESEKQITPYNQQSNSDTTPIERINTESEKQNYPFFWQIERDGKKSYILGTIHRDIKLEDLPYHEEIKRHLRSVDLFLPESTREDGKELQDYMDSNQWIDDNLQRVYEQEDALTENKTIRGLVNIIRNRMIELGRDNSDRFLSLSEKEQNFLLNLYHNHPEKEFIQDLSSMMPPQIENFIISTVPHARLSLKPKIFLDQTVEDYFVQHNGAIATASLDNLKDFSLMHTAKYLTLTMKDVKDFIENYSERFSDETIAQQKSHIMRIDEQATQFYLSGENNEQILMKDFFDREKGFLETELRQDTTDDIFTLDFRNSLWLPKIIEAFEQHNSIFIMAGVAHFIRLERNPLNMPEFEGYTERNKNIPSNILDMLKNEGFKITRLGEGDFIPASSCQSSFL